VRAAVELARTDADHEDMMWQRLRVIAAEDVGLAEPGAIAIVAALHDSAELFSPGSYERATFAAQAAAYLAAATKDPTASEILQVALHDDLPPEIPDEAICVHTKRGQLMGRTVKDWWFTGSQVAPERPGRPTAWREQLDAIRKGEPDRPPLPDP
jgi:hypothetical protein